MKNVRNPHILRTLFILNFYDVLKIFRDFIWLRCYLNSFFTLNGCSNESRKNQNSKILTNEQGYEDCEESHILCASLFSTSLIFLEKNWDFI